MCCEGFKPDFPTETIKEGRVEAIVPKLKAYQNVPSDYAPSKAPVFYNPVMELNRDLAVLALQAYQRRVNRPLRVCEPLTACGLRGIRFAAEVDGVKKVVMGDINERAFQLARCNVEKNGLTDVVEVKNREANHLLSRYSAPHRRFDFVDIDPFGSPVPFIDSAVRALRDGGLLALTATDMAPLCGVHPRACIRKYGGKPLRTEYCHELAARLVAGSLATTAAKYGMGTEVVFAHQAEHYVRIYAVVHYGANKADESLKNMGYLLHCFKCLHRETIEGLLPAKTQELCRECGSKLSISGPMWTGKLFDSDFCRSMGKDVRHYKFTLGRQIEKMLALAEAESDTLPSYYVVDKISDVMGLPVPSVKKVAQALRDDGYEASLTVFHSRGIKSNAPASKMQETVRQLTNNCMPLVADTSKKRKRKM